METISVGIALQGGEPATRIIAAIDEHPLLESCGIARSIPDLLRLLSRFEPAVMLISPALLEELEPGAADRAAAAALSSPLSFLLSEAETVWGEAELAGMLQQPLRFGGIINRDHLDGEDLYQRIRSRVELHEDRTAASGPPRTRGHRGDRAAELVVFTGSKGGVGTTLVSCTAAMVLAPIRRRVLLLDMDRELSQLLHIVPGNGSKTVSDLLPLAEELSWDLVRLSIHRHDTGFYALPYGRPAGERGGRGEGMPESFLRNLLFLFDTVIVDLPRPTGEVFPVLLRHVPVVLLVSMPDPLSANCARRASACLRRIGLDRGRLHMVVNRCGSHHVLGPEELAAAAGLNLLAPLPEDARSGSAFAELGELPRPSQPLVRAVAQMLAGLGFEAAPPDRAPSRSGFGRRRRMTGDGAAGGRGA